VGADLHSSRRAGPQRLLRKRGGRDVQRPRRHVVAANAPSADRGPQFELAVRADLDELGDLPAGSGALGAAALAMARILDDRRLVTTQPSAARQLERVDGGAAPRRRAAPGPARGGAR
jgi:hypothetical protein